MLLRLDHFLALTGSLFTVPFDDGSVVRLLLREANPLPTREFPGRTREAFELMFLGPGATPLTPASYHVRHPVLGGFPLLLTPLGRDEIGDYIYQSVFN